MEILETTRSGLYTYTRYEDDECDKCGAESPERCEKGHCMECVAKDTFGYGKCYCGGCLKCKGHAGGNECNVCAD